MEQLPHSLDAEKALLGIILNHNDRYYDVSDLRKEMWWEPWHGELFSLLADIILPGGQATAITVMHQAQDADIGGIPASVYLRQLEDNAPHAGLIKGFANVIRQTAIDRALWAFTDEIRALVSSRPASMRAEDVRQKAEDALGATFSSVADTGLRPIGEVGDGVLDAIKRAGAASAGLPIGLSAVQSLTGAFLPGRWYNIAGSSGSGKTGLAQQIAEFVGKQGKITAVFSADMPSDELAVRAMTAETGIEGDNIERNLLGNDQFETLWNANEALRHLPIFIDDTTRPTMAMIRARAARKKKMGGLDLVIVDHFHLLRGSSPKLSSYETHEENAIEMKAMAKDLQVPVLSLSQLSTPALNDLAKWPFPKPNQSHLLFAAAIERSADVVGILYREEYFLKRNPLDKDDRNRALYDTRLFDAKGKAHFILTKRRGGADSGIREMSFDGPRVRFSDNVLKAMFKSDELPFAMTG